MISDLEGPRHKLPQPARPGLFPCRSPIRIPTDGTKGHRAVGDSQVGPASLEQGWGTAGLRTACTSAPTKGCSSLRGGGGRSVLIPVSRGLFASGLSITSVNIALHPPGSPACYQRSYRLVGPPRPLHVSLPHPAEGEHRSQEKQAHSLPEEEPRASCGSSTGSHRAHTWPCIRARGALKLQTPGPIPKVLCLAVWISHNS